MATIVDVGTARFSVTDVGAGTPVVLLHAGVADRRSWDGSTASLAGSAPTHRFLAYDRRGFGDAEWEPAQHSSLSDLIAILEACDAAPAVLVGSSQGGRLAIDLALARPDLVLGLVLVGSAVSGAPGPDSAQQARISKLSDSIDEAEEAEDLDLVNELECHLWLDGPESTKGRVGGELRTLFLAMNGRALRAGDIGEAIWAMDSWNRLEELNVPTTVIVGDLDLPHIVERSTTMARRIPGATLVEVNEVAHLVAFEDPIGFSELLTSFLGSLTIIGHEAAHGLVDRDGHRQPRQPR